MHVSLAYVPCLLVFFCDAVLFFLFFLHELHLSSACVFFTVPPSYFPSLLCVHILGFPHCLQSSWHASPSSLMLMFALFVWLSLSVNTFPLSHFLPFFPHMASLCSMLSFSCILSLFSCANYNLCCIPSFSNMPFPTQVFPFSCALPLTHFASHRSSLLLSFFLLHENSLIFSFLHTFPTFLFVMLSFSCKLPVSSMLSLSRMLLFFAHAFRHLANGFPCSFLHTFLLFTDAASLSLLTHSGSFPPCSLKFPSPLHMHFPSLCTACFLSLTCTGFHPSCKPLTLFPSIYVFCLLDALSFSCSPFPFFFLHVVLHIVPLSRTHSLTLSLPP